MLHGINVGSIIGRRQNAWQPAKKIFANIFAAYVFQTTMFFEPSGWTRQESQVQFRSMPAGKGRRKGLSTPQKPPGPRRKPPAI
mmetsp:Transcript_18776/g.38131  ORF Transcript_18776/g.38131 Transcript_18776/m.38131 type:complete len:84 (+) Transcript_18776:201-452(+)